MTLGILNLGDRQITAALTGEVITEASSPTGAPQAFVDRLEGMVAATLQVKFGWGSGGTSCAVAVQTTLDQGASWIDVARFDFTTATATKVANLSGLLSKAVAAVAPLGAEGAFDGVFGDRFRAVVTSVGAYQNTTVSVRMHAR